MKCFSESALIDVSLINFGELFASKSLHYLAVLLRICLLGANIVESFFCILVEICVFIPIGFHFRMKHRPTFILHSYRCICYYKIFLTFIFNFVIKNLPRDLIVV